MAVVLVDDFVTDLLGKSNAPELDIFGQDSHIYLVSLPQREDRRDQMERLRIAQGFEWTTYDAIDSSDPIIENIIHQVGLHRELFTNTASFRWPRNINALSITSSHLLPSESDLWPILDYRIHDHTPSHASSNVSHSGPLPSNLTCATDDYTILPFNAGLSDFRVLTAPKVACWYSHISAIRRFADSNNTGPDDIAIILEDDIDMEQDIRQRMHSLWGSLPVDWEIVFFGHCWSNESFYPPLPRPSSDNAKTFQSSSTQIHPSFAPKCTHAYALSRSGARRLLLHLRYPLFAYSRALDQAYAWLVESGRLRSYSVVPSIVVQRKIGKSDVMAGMGSAWRETLDHGVFDG
ncbi:hypothetical protein BJ138DRAFT_1174016 [Hygrophoropsis aurantiaca]|uniref:Uncharacterized protein n=1 Tax=Hygrophoropsis aurantiaca TaxID=72124 RepID=A0ACB8A6B7_9AGAM|nr:hypothetical protein BJ138DRAFT_1174016 [Hygrophoropsis aurantiaca]